MAMKKNGILVLVSALVCPCAVQAGWTEMLKPLGSALETPAAGGTAAGAALSQQELVSGLKQALSLGAERAIGYLGQDGGFLDDAEVRIPLPSSLRQVQTGLEAVGKGDLADEFVATMNHAAERAVPEAAGIFGEAIQEMSLEDAQAVLQGPDDAATAYFRRNSEAELREAMLPIVRQATQSVGVTSAYKQFMGAGGGLIGQFLGADLDVDRYVTDKALDGLFFKLAEEERLIRENPAARSTELLQKVFGAVGG